MEKTLITNDKLSWKVAYEMGNRFMVFITTKRGERRCFLDGDDFPETCIPVIMRAERLGWKVSNCHEIKPDGSLVDIETNTTDMADKEVMFTPDFYHTDEGKPRFTMVCIDKRHLFTNLDDCDAMFKRLNALIEKKNKNWTPDDHRFLSENGYEWMNRLIP